MNNEIKGNTHTEMNKQEQKFTLNHRNVEENKKWGTHTNCDTKRTGMIWNV